MMGHEILTKFVGTQFSQFGCPATGMKVGIRLMMEMYSL